MLVIKLKFINRRFHATPWGHHVNEAKAEWPPSPWRLLRALIAVWQRKFPSLSKQEDMELLLTKLATLPSFYLPHATQSATRHYMPTHNKKTLVFDAWVNVVEPVYFVWKHLELHQTELRVLDDLLQGLSYFGRSEAWCWASIVDAYPEINCAPEQAPEGDYETVRVLAAREDVTYDQLTVETSDLQKDRWSDPPGSRWVEYYRLMRPFDAVYEGDKKPERKRKSDYVLARYLIDTTVLPLVQDTVSIAETARGALIGRHYRRNDERHSPTFSGKDSSRKPLEGHKHAHYLPHDLDGDGRIDHLSVWAKDGFDEAELYELERLSILTQRGKEEKLNIVLLGFLKQKGIDQISGFSKSRLWTSCTPFMLVHHMRKNRDKTQPKAQLRKELERRGLLFSEEDVEIEQIETLKAKGHKELHWLEFRRWLNKRGPRGKPPHPIGFGFKLTFKEDLPGPICLGWGCHYGLGMFRPSE